MPAAMPIKVSVVVPVYNPGSNLDDLLASLLGQSLPDDEYEAILVDDGSTDGTGERLDAWAAPHPHMRVEHIPNSGWPGRPRNVGTDLARGEYVLYADNDDWLDGEALERLHDRAVRDDADVVVGRVLGHGKNVPRELFRRDRRDVGLDWPPLVRLLSPHKLFRRALLDEHGIRFPEGRQRLEDHVFVLQAYFAAEHISILAGHPVYHWVRRDGTNASWVRMDAERYFRHDLPAVLDVLDAGTQPGERRDALYTHWWRSKALHRLQGGSFARRDPDHNREIYAEVRRLADERFPARLDARLPFAARLAAALVRADRFDGLVALAAYERRQRARVRELRRTAEGGAETLRLECRIGGPGARLVARRDGDRLRWEPPADLVAHVADLDLDVTDEVAAGHVDALVHTAAGDEHLLPVRRRTRLRPVGDDPDRVTPVVICTATLDPATAGSGDALGPGRWRVGAVVRIAGFSATGDATGADGEPVEVEIEPPATPSVLKRRLARIGPLRRAVRAARART